jgi:hypothetical protein
MNVGICSGTVVTLTLVMAGIWWLSKNSSRRRQIADRVSEVNIGMVGEIEASDVVYQRDHTNTHHDHTNTHHDHTNTQPGGAEFAAIQCIIKTHRKWIVRDVPEADKDGMFAKVLAITTDLADPHSAIAPHKISAGYQVEVVTHNRDDEAIRDFAKVDDHSYRTRCHKLMYKYQDKWVVVSCDWVKYVLRALKCLLDARPAIGYINDIYYE